MNIEIDAIFADADEKWIKNIVLYGKDDDNYLYITDIFTAKYRVTKRVLIEIFKKGLIIFYKEAFYLPISLTITDDHVSVDISDGTKTITLSSAEKDADENEDDFVMDIVKDTTGYWIEVEKKDYNMDDVVNHESELVEGKFNFQFL